MAKVARRLLTLTLCAGLLLSLNLGAAELEEDAGIRAQAEAIVPEPSPELQEFPWVAWRASLGASDPFDGCSAQRTCPPEISCQGTGTCSTGTACFGLPYVECDGNRTYCPRLCEASAECCSWQYCDRYYCAGIGPGTCSRGCCECLEE